MAKRAKEGRKSATKSRNRSGNTPQCRHGFKPYRSKREAGPGAWRCKSCKMWHA